MTTDPPTPVAETETSDSERPEALDLLLQELRVPVREDLARQVMASLPEAPWRRRSTARAAVWAVAAAVLLLAAAGWLLSGGQGGGLGALATVAELFATGFAAGAGLLAASWSGLGRIVDQALGGSISAAAALAAAGLVSYAVLFRLLRRRRRVRARHR